MLVGLVEVFSLLPNVTEQTSQLAGALRSSVHIVGLVLPLKVLMGDGEIHWREVLLIRKSDSTATDVSSSSLSFYNEIVRDITLTDTRLTLRLTACSGVSGGESVITVG